MRKYVAILKTVGDLKKRGPAHRKSPMAYPLIVEEFETHDAAVKAHPTKQVMDLEQYNAHKAKMNELKDAKRPRPWWKFWAKK